MNSKLNVRELLVESALDETLRVQKSRLRNISESLKKMQSSINTTKSLLENDSHMIDSPKQTIVECSRMFKIARANLKEAALDINSSERFEKISKAEDAMDLIESLVSDIESNLHVIVDHLEESCSV